MSESDKTELINGVESGELKVQAVQPRWKSWARLLSSSGTTA